MSKFPNIDRKFIYLEEGSEIPHTKFYVPCDKSGVPLGKSGITIGHGVDLGQWDDNDLRQLHQDIPEMEYLGLGMYTNIIGEQALNVLKCNLDDEISEADAKTLSEWVYDRIFKQVDAYLRKASDRSISVLHPALATAVGSLAIQYGGNLPKAMPKLWRVLVAEDIYGVYLELMDFGDAYKSRRQREAKLLQDAKLLSTDS